MDFKQEWQQRAEAAEAEAAGLRTRCQGLAKECAALEDDREYNATIIVERDEELINLRQQLDTVTALAPETEWLEMVACYPNGCAGCPYHRLVTGTLCDIQCNKIGEVAGNLAARIHAWRGDGGRGEEREGESDGN